MMSEHKPDFIFERIEKGLITHSYPSPDGKSWEISHELTDDFNIEDARNLTLSGLKIMQRKESLGVESAISKKE
jgi:hypothetical protein